MKTYIFFGKSGSGKGTQALLLKEQLEAKGEKVIYIETGQLFRNFAETNNLTSKKVKEALSSGNLLPEFLPAYIWANALINNFTGEETLILDGIARRSHEAPILDSALSFYGFDKRFVVYINVSDSWATERLLSRGRGDDKEMEIKKRLDWFEWNTIPSIAYFHELSNYTFLDINGEQSIEEVHDEIINKISL